jgi:primosomal protein N' (replication factor Y)
MYILEIIPIKRGIPFDILSYYHKDPVSVGGIIEAPFKNGSLYGIVMACKSLIEMRQEVRGASFNYKKIKSVTSDTSAFSSIAKSIERVSSQLCVPNAHIARFFIPELLITNAHTENFAKKDIGEEIEYPLVHTVELAMDTIEERAALHKRTIREYMAKKKSIVLIAPTILEVETWGQTLATGIEDRIAVLHSEKKKKEIAHFYTQMEDIQNPKVFIVTPSFFAIPRADIGAVIIENQQSTLYISRDRYSIDMRFCIAMYAKERNIPLIYGSSMPSFDILAETSSTLPRHLTPENIQVVEIQKQTGTLPTEIIELVAYCIKQKKTLFIYANQKGFAPISMCRDCKSILECTYCKLPLKLAFKDKKDRNSERIFICTNCERTYPTETNCTLCHSWNISAFAVGSDALYTEVLEYVDKDHVYIVDNTHSPDEKTIQSYIQKSEKQEYSIYIGTKKLLPYLPTFDYCAIPFFDRLIQIPSYTTVEDMLDVVTTMAAAAKEQLILCTRNPELPLIEQLQNKKIQALIADELTIREKLEYPPFATLHKITINAYKNKEEYIKNALIDFFASIEMKYTIQSKKEFSDFGEKISITCILKTTDLYMEEQASEIKDFLATLSPQYAIERNPRRLL